MPSFLGFSRGMSGHAHNAGGREDPESRCGQIGTAKMSICFFPGRCLARKMKPARSRLLEDETVGKIED